MPSDCAKLITKFGCRTHSGSFHKRDLSRICPARVLRKQKFKVVIEFFDQPGLRAEVSRQMQTSQRQLSQSFALHRPEKQLHPRLPEHIDRLLRIAHEEYCLACSIPTLRQQLNHF